MSSLEIRVHSQKQFFRCYSIKDYTFFNQNYAIKNTMRFSHIPRITDKTLSYPKFVEDDIVS